MRALGWTILAALGGAALLYALYLAAIGWRPAESQYPIQGVTIGAEQGAIRWPTLKASGADFVYLAATDGDQAIDPAFAANRAAAKAAGIRYGVIHKWQLCRLAADQITNFVTHVPRNADMLPPAVALTFDGNCDDRPDVDILIGELTAFLQVIESYAGKPAVIFVSRQFDKTYDITGRADRSFWLQRRLFPPDYGAEPWTMWEASDIRRVAGVENPARWSVVRPSKRDRVKP